MADATQYTWPILLDPPGAVDVGNNSYRLPSGATFARSFLTTVAHVGVNPDDSKYGPGTSIYSDGTVRRPDLSIVADLKQQGVVLQLGGMNPATGRQYTSNDAPRNSDGTPFQWGRTQALAAAGVAPAVADAYAKGGVDILATSIPINSGNPITFGPYKGLFPDSKGGTTLVDASGIVRVSPFDYADYFRKYSPVQYDASGMEISAVNGNAGAYRTYAPDPDAVANMTAPVDDTFGTSPTLPPGVYSTGGMPKVNPLPSPSLVSGGSDLTREVQPMTTAATAKPYPTSDKTTWVAIGIVLLAAFGISRKGR